MRGGSGDFGARFEGATAFGGNGGDSHFDGGALGRIEGISGMVGLSGSGGGGAGGASNGATARAGGSGGSGVCLVREYFEG